jgi:two-component system sensor histidine kinase RegB
LERTLGPGSPHADDIKLLGEQARRCRDILAKLTELSTAAEPFDRMKLSGIIEEVVAPHRNFGVTIEVKLPPNRPTEPVGARNPAVLYGLGNLVENAVDFARLRVDVSAEWTEEEVTVTVADDGPGFSPEVLGRLGEPYVTSRGSGRPAAAPESGGLGLGFFIAKTLIERSGGTLACVNRPPPQSGAVVSVRWARPDFEKQPEITEI